MRSAPPAASASGQMGRAKPSNDEVAGECVDDRSRCADVTGGRGLRRMDGMGCLGERALPRSAPGDAVQQTVGSLPGLAFGGTQHDLDRRCIPVAVFLPCSDEGLIKSDHSVDRTTHGTKGLRAIGRGRAFRQDEIGQALRVAVGDQLVARGNRRGRFAEAGRASLGAPGQQDQHSQAPGHPHSVRILRVPAQVNEDFLFGHQTSCAGAFSGQSRAPRLSRMRRSAMAGAALLASVLFAATLASDAGLTWRRILVALAAALAGAVVFLLLARWQARRQGRPWSN
jgi:hypothetical protein